MEGRFLKDNLGNSLLSKMKMRYVSLLRGRSGIVKESGRNVHFLRNYHLGGLSSGQDPGTGLYRCSDSLHQCCLPKPGLAQEPTQHAACRAGICGPDCNKDGSTMDWPTKTSMLAVYMAKHPSLFPLMACKSAMPKQGHQLHYYYSLYYILLLYIIVINI